MLVVSSKAEDHRDINAAARPFLSRMGLENGFEADFGDTADVINEENLARYQVFLMLNLAPFEMTVRRQEALQSFIERGGGWVGVHAAGLTGKDFTDPATPYWQWFEELLGGITYIPHPAYQTGRLVIEDRLHPVTRNLPASFDLSCEWYEFDKSPRNRVHVLATADESSFKQVVPMGDHPMVWINEQYRRAVYIALGHDSTALANKNYAVLLRDAILWAASTD